MPFYLAWIFSNFSHWKFKSFSISELSYGTNQDFIPFIQAQFFVAQYPQKLHSGISILFFFQWAIDNCLEYFSLILVRIAKQMWIFQVLNTFLGSYKWLICLKAYYWSSISIANQCTVLANWDFTLVHKYYKNRVSLRQGYIPSKFFYADFQ